MWLLLGLIGLTAGMVTSAGLVALLNAVGLIPRMAGRTRTASHLYIYETMILMGCGLGNAVYLWELSQGIPIWMMILFGFCAGTFSGSLVMALAETLSVIPVFLRRIHLRTGLPIMVAAFAFGKLAGALFYFAEIG